MAAKPRKRPGEFALIERYFRPLAGDAGAFALTDDAAVYRQRPGEDLVVTTDMIAAGIHFLADDAPASIARKALRVNLSDLAAKGATPFGYLLGLALPGDWTESWLAGFARGLKSDQERYGVTLIGGDTIRAADALTISVTALGRIPKGRMVTRAGARPGDAIYVSGTIGDSALGLAAMQGRIDAGEGRGAKHLIDRYLHPQPRMALAPVLRRHASSAMDVSDGLIADLAHICDVSGVGAEIEAPLVPLSPPARRLVAGDPALIRDHCHRWRRLRDPGDGERLGSAALRRRGPRGGRAGQPHRPHRRRQGPAASHRCRRPTCPARRRRPYAFLA